MVISKRRIVTILSACLIIGGLFFSIASPVRADNLNSLFTYSCSSDRWADTCTADYFNTETGTWNQNGSETATITAYNPDGIVINQIDYSDADGYYNYPLYIKGSTNGTDWTTLLSTTITETNNIRISYTFANSTAYNYYRVEIPNQGWRVGCHFVEMIGTAAPTATPIPPTPTTPQPTATPTPIPPTPTGTIAPTPTPNLTPTVIPTYHLTGSEYVLSLKNANGYCTPQGSFTNQLYNNPYLQNTVCQGGMRSSSAYSDIAGQLLGSLPKDQGDIFYYTATILLNDAGYNFLDFAVGYGWNGSGTNGKNFGAYLQRGLDCSASPCVPKFTVHYQYWDSTNNANADGSMDIPMLSDGEEHTFTLLYALGNFSLEIDSGAPLFTAPVPHNYFYTDYSEITPPSCVNPYTGCHCINQYRTDCPKTLVIGNGTDFSHATFNFSVSGQNRVSEISANHVPIRNSAIYGTAVGNPQAPAPACAEGDWLCGIKEYMVSWLESAMLLLKDTLLAVFIPTTPDQITALKYYLDTTVASMKEKAPLAYVILPLQFIGDFNFTNVPDALPIFTIPIGLPPPSPYHQDIVLDMRPPTEVQNFINATAKPIMVYIVDAAFIMLYIRLAMWFFGINIRLGAGSDDTVEYNEWQNTHR
jgi:hypothetical protein